MSENLETATLGAGCFWCVEAVLERIQGVESVVSGYMGGHVENPTYQQVITKTTGHIEVVQVKFDPEVLSYENLLEVFWALHDPTTKDRQGADVGPQYRSVIFTYSDAQEAAAEQSLKAKDASGTYSDPIVTEIRTAETFYKAEGYHQDYYETNPNAGYCRFVIYPKLVKLKLAE